MNILDVIIIVLVLTALYRGYELGFARQLFSTAGFIIGLGAGSLLQRYTVSFGETPLSRSLLSLLTTLGVAFIFLAIGETVGLHLKERVSQWKIDRVDGWLGSILGAATLLLAVWLAAAILRTLPFPNTQAQIRNSAIVTRIEDRKSVV